MTREIRLNVRLRRLGLLEVDAEGQVTRAEARLVMNHGAGYVYLAGGGDRERTARDLARALAGIEGVAGGVDARGLSRRSGCRPPARTRSRGTSSSRRRRDSISATRRAARRCTPRLGIAAPTASGPPTPDNAAFFLAAGAGVRRGAELGPIVSRDVAPTLAHLLGLTMDNVEGRRLDEALS